MAELKDKKIKCVKCGKEFVWTAKAQEYFKKNKLSKPKRCLLCRKKRQAIAFLVKMLWPPKELIEPSLSAESQATSKHQESK